MIKAEYIKSYLQIKGIVNINIDESGQGFLNKEIILKAPKYYEVIESHLNEEQLDEKLERIAKDIKNAGLEKEFFKIV